MYAIRRGKSGKGQFLAEGPVYTRTNPLGPSPLWQHIDGEIKIYTEKCHIHITLRKERIEKIYKAHTLTVVELTNEQLEYLTFRKLKGR